MKGFIKMMEDDPTKLNIADEEEEEPIQGQEEDDESEEEYNFCLVGRVLTYSVVYLPSMIIYNKIC